MYRMVIYKHQGTAILKQWCSGDRLTLLVPYYSGIVAQTLGDRQQSFYTNLTFPGIPYIFLNRTLQ